MFQYSGVARASRGGEVWRAIFGWLVVAGVGIGGLGWGGGNEWCTRASQHLPSLFVVVNLG